MAHKKESEEELKGRRRQPDSHKSLRPFANGIDSLEEVKVGMGHKSVRERTRELVVPKAGWTQMDGPDCLMTLVSGTSTPHSLVLSASVLYTFDTETTTLYCPVWDLA